MLGGEGAQSLPVSLAEGGFDFFTLVPVADGAAVFGLLDKYVGPAAVVSATRAPDVLEVRLREGGDFGAWLERPPTRVELDGRTLSSTAYAHSPGAGTALSRAAPNPVLPARWTLALARDYAFTLACSHE